MSAQPPGQLSPDGKWYWDGKEWASATSPDGRFRWNGREWTSVKRMWFGDYVNQTIVLLGMGAVGTFLCPALLAGAFYALGIGGGVMALRQTPNRQVQAIIGIVGNTIGLIVLILLFVGAVATRKT